MRGAGGLMICHIRERGGRVLLPEDRLVVLWSQELGIA